MVEVCRELDRTCVGCCRDLYRIAKFLSEKGYEADMADCRKRFPGLLTFSEFLELTNWGNASRNYADGFKY